MRTNTTRDPATRLMLSARGLLKFALFISALVLVPPFVLLAIAPMLLLSLPIALVGLPFLISALLRGSLQACREDRCRRERQGLKLRRADATSSA
jgi:hypothetical protein